MKKLINFITILFILPLLNTNIYAVEVIDKGAEVIDKIKNDGTTILKSLTRKSLNKDEIKNFLIEYVITIDDERGDGIVTYFFDNATYKRFKDLELISEDKWKISYLDKKLKIYYGKSKFTWKIQPGIKNIISIKQKITSVGKQYEFSYQNKTDYHVKLEEKKIKDKK
jgi:hypothetical protein